MNVIKALFFFYYLLILPFIWLGKKIWWCMFADTMGKKKAAEAAAIKAARKKGPEALEKLGVVSLHAEVEKYKNEREGKEREKLKEEEKEQKKAMEEAKKEIMRQEKLGISLRNEVEEEEEQRKAMEEEEEISRHQGVSLRNEVERYNNEEGAAEMGWPVLRQDNLEFYDDNLWAEDVPNLLDAAAPSVDDECQVSSPTGEQHGGEERVKKRNKNKEKREEKKRGKKHKRHKEREDGKELKVRKPKKKRKPHEPGETYHRH